MRQPRRQASPALRRQLETELIREASRLAAASGAQVAVFTTRPNGETRAYGSPSPQDVVQRYLRIVDPDGARWHRKQNKEAATPESATSMEEERRDLERNLEILEEMKAKVDRRMAELAGDGDGDSGAAMAGTTSNSSRIEKIKHENLVS